LSKKKRRKPQPPPASCAFFSLASIRLLKEAVTFLEEGLLQSPDDMPNVLFAKDLILKLKRKLGDMLEMEDWEKRTPLDYNEVHILSAALHAYLVLLKVSKQHHILPRCILLCNQFRLLMQDPALKAVPGKQECGE
jgi:hypothetical protein